MKLWLASYPRSGNTFTRSVFESVYGVDSSAYSLAKLKRGKGTDYASSTVVKTHELYRDVPPELRNYPKVLLVRDGRDCVVSMAHQARDIQGRTGRSLERHMRDVIKAPRGNHFGGWSANVLSWIEEADVVIRFEDLIENPLVQIERIRPFLPDLPAAQVDRLMSFDELRAGASRFGSRKNDPDHARKFFRRGKAGAWRDEMPADLRALFWKHHGATMERLGYASD